MPSFSTALSGLAAQSNALDVVGNNLANLNTAGYKADSIQFKDVMGEASNSVPGGLGVATASIAKQFNQGSIQSNGGALSAAIQGNGFFVLKDSSGNTLYTRAGAFTLDSQGYLVTSSGQRVQGWTAANNSLNATGPISDISVNGLSLPAPSATANMGLQVNLDSSAAVNDTFSTPITVSDSLGATHTLTATFTKTGANAWSYSVTIPGEDLATGTPGTPTVLQSGNLTFNSSGQLTSPAFGSPITVQTTGGLADGALDLSITWDPYNPDQTGMITQFAQASASLGTTQDGQEATRMTDLRLTDGGNLIAELSNGKQLTLAQLAVASVQNPDSMVSVGNNDYAVGQETMTPSIGLAGTGIRGNVIAQATEASNVDLAREFTNLIVYQRGYQANSKMITTLDQLTQVLLNIKQ